MTKYIVDTKAINLSQKEFLASGGFGSVYVKSDTAYKIYTDPANMIPIGKFQELSVLDHPSIIKPEKIILDEHSKNVGYTMKFVDDNYVLCQLFTKIFKEKNNIDAQTTLNLVRKLQDIVQYIHSKHILVVDLNEMNFLVSKKFDNIYAIDVDSYQTSSFPAPAIMDSIRDRKVKHNQFTELSDWYSFAILAFNLWILIHPYRGRHPKIKDWNERIEKDISVFDPQVSLPGSCEPFNIIPEAYLNWFKAVFSGKRLPPPKDLQTIVNIITTIKKVLGSNIFEIKELLEAKEQINNIIYTNNQVYITKSGLSYINNRQSLQVSPKAEIIILPKSNTVIAGYIENKKLILKNLSNQTDISCDLFISDIMVNDNRFYIKDKTSIYEIKFIEIGNKLLVSTNPVVQILEFASKLFPGTCIQNLLGATYASFFPKEGTHNQLQLKELNGYKIIDAKHERRILIVNAAKSGIYHRFIFKFDSTYSNYTVRVKNNITLTDVNFTVLDNGICAHLNDEEKLELFVVSNSSNDIKEIEDSTVLSGDMKLMSYGTQVMFTKNNKLYSLKMVK